jgi:transglutaminase-like putative cysteine protease
VSAVETSMLFKIRHVTGFSYDGVADSSYNEARMTPVNSERQRVLESSLSVHPFAVQSTYRDYFGTIVTTFDLQQSHHRLQVVAEATVETTAEVHTEADLPLSALRTSENLDLFAEYLASTPRTTLSGAVIEEVRSLVSGQDDVHVAATSIVEWVRERVAYVRGATKVSSTAQEVWDQREGVCQDLSHVTIALLRCVGVPARYVSGYLYSKDEDRVGEKVVGESHAWVEYYCGDWFGVDPTNGGKVGLHHVVVAKGREYGDVSPLKGIYHGDRSSALGVVVEITRVG